MKRIKKYVLLLIVFILSGCTVKYDLTINSDLSVTEKVEATEYTVRMNALTGMEQDLSVDYIYNMYSRDNYVNEEDQVINSSTDLTYRTVNNETIATVTVGHSSLDEFEGNFTSDIFEKVDITEDGDLVTLNFDQTKLLSDNSSSSSIYDEIEVNIEVPFEVTDHNADSKRWNTYTWKLKKTDGLKNISITFDKNNKSGEQKFSIGSISFSVKYQIIAFVIIGLVILGIVIIVYINNKKNNKV